jgi:putative transposase
VNKQLYPSDITDSQWEIIQELIPKAKSGAPGGYPPRSLEMRQVINAILYVTVGGIQWRMMPKEYPKWQSVYHYFRIWRKAGIWRRIHDTLRAMVRRKAGRHKHPTAGCADSQSVKTTAIPGIRGYDSGKHVKGRKRHILVDTLGL